MEGGAEIAEDFGGLFGHVVLFHGVGFHVVEFLRSPGGVVDDLPVAAAEGLDGEAAVGGSTFTPNEVVVALGKLFGDAGEDRFQADAFHDLGDWEPGDVADGGGDVHADGGGGEVGSGLDLAGPAGGEGDAEAAFIHVLLLAAPWAVVGFVFEDAAVVTGEDDEGVVGKVQLVQGVEDLADAVVHVLDEGDEFGPDVGHAWLAGFDFFDPVGRWLNGVVRGVVSEIEEEGGVFRAAGGDVIHGPLGEEVGCMALGVDDVAVVAHEVVAVAEVGPVIVHHVAEEAVEVVEPPVERGVGRFQAEVPLADDGAVVAGGLEVGRNHDGIVGEVAPGVFGPVADDAGDAHAVGVAAGEECGAGGGADGAVGEEVVHGRAFGEKPVNGGRPDVRGAEGGVVAATEVIGEDDDDVGARVGGRGGFGDEQGHREGEDGDEGLEQTHP